MDNHLYDTPLDGADELCAPFHRVGAVHRHDPDDPLHSAFLPDAQGVRNEKRDYMAYRRLGCRARCAAAFDELRRHAAVER